MKHLIKILLLTFIYIFSCQEDHAQPHEIENRKWILEQIKENETGKIKMVDEYHFLELKDGRLHFLIDCNRCSMPYHFVGGDSISIGGLMNCTRRNCIEKDSIKIDYSGKHKIWLQDGYLVFRTMDREYTYK